MVDISGGRANDIDISPSETFVMIMASRNESGQKVSEIVNKRIENLVNKQE